MDIMKTNNGTCWTGTTKVSEVPNTGRTTVGYCQTHDLLNGVGPFTVLPGENKLTTLLSARYTSIDDGNPTPYPYPNPSDLIQAAMNDLSDAQGMSAEQLFEEHLDAVAELQNRIEVTGNDELARVVNASLYAMNAGVSATVNYSTSPGGLPTNAYNGHAFWDVETWMWPTWLAFFPDIAKSVLEYRYLRRDPAKQNAMLHNFSGLMFPWESAFSGVEVDPAQGTTTEEHLQGDIAFAFRQYYEATGDVTWLKTTGFEVIEGIATFWASKAVRNANGTYSIPNIMGPDEYHGGVTDSAYCNVIARFSLYAAYELASVVGQTQNSTFKEIGDNLLIPYDKNFDYHPEFAGYTRGTKVKQADTIMLGYPLLYKMNKRTRINDLEYYENVTDENGPAMTWSMFCIGYLDIAKTEPNEFNQELSDKAASFFTRGYANNAIGPYRVWHEVVGGGGAPNFITGAGGFMQSVWAGYGGIRFSSSALELKAPQPLPNSTKLVLRNVQYLGNKLTIEADEHYWSVVLMHASTTKLQIASDSKPGKFSPLVLDSMVEFQSGESASITRLT
eukprot:m.66143 g.66143  ORF g.66143 m.66143 type:complete len:560 (-) comp11784_c0_seq2:129-1808(-)